MAHHLPEPTHPEYPQDRLPRAIYAALIQGRGVDYVQTILDVHGTRYLNWPIMGSGLSVLQFLCKANFADHTRSVIQMRGDINIVDFRGHDAFTIAVRNQAHEVVRLFLTELHVSPLGHTPVRFTMGVETTEISPSTGHERTVFGPETLTDLPASTGMAISLLANMRSAPVGPPDRRDLIFSFILRACHGINPDRSILRHGNLKCALTYTRSTCTDLTLLFWLVFRGFSISANTLMMQLPGKIDPNRGRDRHGNTCLHLALTFLPECTCARLINAGADTLTPNVPRLDIPPPAQDEELYANTQFTLPADIIAPVDIARVAPDHPRFPKSVRFHNPMGMFMANQNRHYLRMHVAAGGMWRWQLSSPPTSASEEQSSASKEQSPRVCSRWPTLPRDIVRLIIGHLLPSYFSPALDERLERYHSLYRRHHHSGLAIEAPQTPSRA